MIGARQGSLAPAPPPLTLAIVAIVAIGVIGAIENRIVHRSGEGTVPGATGLGFKDVPTAFFGVFLSIGRIEHFRARIGERDCPRSWDTGGQGEEVGRDRVPGTREVWANPCDRCDLCDPCDRCDQCSRVPVGRLIRRRDCPCCPGIRFQGRSNRFLRCIP
jgi:hypothetical protein